MATSFRFSSTGRLGFVFFCFWGSFFVVVVVVVVAVAAAAASFGFVVLKWRSSSLGISFLVGVVAAAAVVVVVVAVVVVVLPWEMPQSRSDVCLWGSRPLRLVLFVL